MRNTVSSQAGRAILRRANLEIFECPLHLEGGSIHTDGEGYEFHFLSHLAPTAPLSGCEREHDAGRLTDRY